MAPGTRSDGQDDFSAGMVRGVARHLMPSNSAYTISDGLLDDDGNIYRRGGSAYKSNANFTAALRFLWDGYFPQIGLRTLVAYSSAFATLASDDATPVAIGGAGLSEPKAVAQIGEFLWIGGGYIYAGSRLTGPYSTGTVTTVLNSAVVTGAGTSWDVDVDIDAGSIIAISGDTQRFYVVKSVDSPTQITLTEPYLGTAAAGQTYTVKAIETVTAAAPAAATRGFVQSEFYASCAGRLLAAVGNRLYMSKPIDPATGRFRPQEANSYDFHDFPEGSQILGVSSVRDRAIVFTTGGVWVISGLANAIVDPSGNPQHRKEQISTELVLWGAPGVAQFENALIAPAADGVYLIDGISPPTPLTRSVRKAVADYVRAGYKPGGAAVYRNHLFLPVLDGSNVVQDCLVCRLDRPVSSRHGTMYPWTQMLGHAGQVTAVVPRAITGSQRSPKLLAAGADKRLLDLSAVFEPASGVKNDADGTTHRLVLETRDFRTGRSGVPNTLRRATVRYVLTDAATDNPTVILYWSVGRLQSGLALWDSAIWDSFSWVDADLSEYVQATGAAPEDDGRTPFAWNMAARGEFVRFRLESSGACATMTVRELALAIRDNANNF